MDIKYKTAEEIESIRVSSLLVSETLAHVAQFIKPGVTTLELDKSAEDFIKSKNAIAAFKGFKGFPGTLCISVNAEVVHGIPTKRVVRDGDVLSVDCGVIQNGWYGDSAYTFGVGQIDQSDIQLLQVTQQCLMQGIAKVKVGNRMGDVSSAIQEYAELHKMGVVRELIGHGIGRNLHEKPDVPNYGSRGQGINLKAGLVIAIEPMINKGKRGIKFHDDGWTVTTIDMKNSAHFEHTVAVTQNGYDVLSSFEPIQSAIEKNINIYNINV
ncbi:MAG TPA: type I methionyl aminopeptidase [Bacteroidia bacterium]|nr:type I methionyl aminopeptidase [Bacteroidia bacterium]HOZ91179.1 type I methionyl aminopeptidase [Bacteroidia bacterium]HRC36335.1 type I methionyl aminopeptidase [Bacteroidia bacterium]